MKKIRLKNIRETRFRRVPKQKRALDRLYGHPIILEYNNGDVFAGTLDDYEKFTIDLAWSFILKSKRLRKTKEYEYNWEQIKNFLTIHPFPNIKAIYRPKNMHWEFKDILDLWINPLHTPLQRSITCDWVKTKKHSSRCDNDLHEALSTIFLQSNNISSIEKKKNFENSVNMIRKFIIEHHGNIP